MVPLLQGSCLSRTGQRGTNCASLPDGLGLECGSLPSHLIRVLHDLWFVSCEESGRCWPAFPKGSEGLQSDPPSLPPQRQPLLAAPLQMPPRDTGRKVSPQENAPSAQASGLRQDTAGIRGLLHQARALAPCKGSQAAARGAEAHGGIEMEERVPGRCRPIRRHPVLWRSSKKPSKMELAEDGVGSAIRLARPGLLLLETHTGHVPPPLRVLGTLALQPSSQGMP